MNEIEAIRSRHSVRVYTDAPLEGDTLARLQDEVAVCNAEGDLHFQLVTDEPEAFGTGIFKYGMFKGVRNYLCCVGADDPSLDERVGYYGERFVLTAQQLGLNTCWVALTFNKKKARFQLAAGERLVLVIAVGYGATPGKPRKSKAAEQVAVADKAPEWFARGVDAALLAPTAMNQQKFRFELLPVGPDGVPHVRATAPKGNLTLVDLGIAKRHFEVAAGPGAFAWT